MSNFKLQKNNRKISTRNYFIVLIVSVLTITLVLYARSFIIDYNETVNNVSILKDNTQSINLEDIEYSIPEIKESIIYVSYTGNSEISKMEKKLYNKIKNTELKEKLIYLDITEYTNNNEYITILKNKFDPVKNEINTAPIFIYIKDGKPVGAVSSELKLIDYTALKKLIDKYKEE